MTFDEWWKEKIMEKNDDIAMIPGTLLSVSRAKEIAHEAWESKQPHWNYCKDGKKPEQDQRVNAIIKPEIKKNPLYVDTVVYRNGNYINELMCHFEDVIAWQPLPEVESE